jgi:feruloyl-CoA synthase
MFYAGAHLSQHVWDRLQRHALAATGERILMLTGLGATETAPFVFMPGREVGRAGEVGLPAPGIDLKLVPLDAARFDVRLRGPNITPGYWRQPELTRQAFDEDGYYRLGDALRFLDPAAPEKGFVFDGRIAEDFKLSTGTWVNVGEVRRVVIAHFAPLLRDAVIAGHDRDEVTALLVPDADAWQRHGADLALLQERLDSLAAGATGSSNRIARALLLDQPLSSDAGEVTDKGSISQQAVLCQRAALVEELYAAPYSPRILVAR